MNVRALSFVLLSLLLNCGTALAQQEMVFTTSKLVTRLLPSVVNITSYLPAAPPSHSSSGVAEVNEETQQRELGSGFVINANGTIVTNYHVIQGGTDIVVTFADGAQATAAILAADRLADIAVLKVSVGRKLSPIRWAKPGELQIGDPVIAVGNPLGVGMSVTSGIVSALNRNIMETPYDNYIQTDAPINHGNSGGPLFDLQGDVVGINTALISPTKGSAGLGFAIPAGDAQFVIGRLEKYGWIKPGWLGIKVQQVTSELADALGLSSTRGAIVADVVVGGPAAKAGLRTGDVIEQYRGRVPPDERALLRDIGMTAEGTKITLHVLREGHELDLTATVGEYPKQKWERVDLPIKSRQVELSVPANLGLTLTPLPESERVQLGIPEGLPAVFIAGVAPGTDAAWRGVARGQAIERIQETPVGSPAEVEQALEQARGDGRAFVALLLAVPKPLNPGPEWKAVRLQPKGE